MNEDIDELKRYLFQLPQKFDFEFTNDVRKNIRHQLFSSISRNCEFLDWLFPGVFACIGENGQFKDKAEVIEKLDKEFDWVYSRYYRFCLSNGGNNIDVHNYHAYHSTLPCARIFHKGEPIYRCLTCGFDDTCALCSNCYRAEHHEGHKVHITICQRENGGVCDCGDPEAWVKDYICPFASELTNSPFYKKEMPAEFEESFFNVLEVLLDFVIDVIANSDLQFHRGDEAVEESVKRNAVSSTLDPSKYGFSECFEITDVLSEKFALVLYNDQVRHFRDAEQRIRLASKKVHQFARMVATQTEEYGKARVISSRNIILLRERQLILGSSGLSTCIRNHRDIFREDMCDEIISWIQALTESEFFNASPKARKLFCRAFCKKWNSGLDLRIRDKPNYAYKVGSLDNTMKIPKIPSQNDAEHNFAKESPNSYWSFTPARWDIPDKVCNECEFNTLIDNYLPNVSHVGSRFQYFIYLDVRFWKSIRTKLHFMYSTSLITNLTYKRVFCCQYVDIYPCVADMFLRMDREPELNIMCTLSTQLFTCPSNSTSIVQHGDLSRIFASIYGFLTVEQIRSPDSIELSKGISMKSLKNRRWSQIFFDIGYILSRSRDSKSILDANIIPIACDILVLFQGKPVMKRESKNHVEYESPDYASFFHAILVIYQFAEYISNCFHNIAVVSTEEKRLLSKSSLHYISSFLMRLENDDYPSIAEESTDITPPSNLRVIYDSVGGNIIKDFNVNEENVSFLHPIHSFFSWIIESSDLNSSDELAVIIESAALRYLQSKENSPLTQLTKPAALLFEYPIRTMALTSQIKAGFWVRNGFSVRSQLQLYRNSGLRDSGYLRDLFLNQVFINLTSPDFACYTILNRWLLSGDFFDDCGMQLDNQIDRTSLKHKVYDSQILLYMIEEIITFFIQIFLEDLFLRGYNSETITYLKIQNEILHNLCFESMSYSKLCSQIPDHIVAEKKFDIVLYEMTDFSYPEGNSGLCIFKLKNRYLDHLNPYYFNYTSNMKEDAIKFAKERIAKKTHDRISDVVIEPKVSGDELGLYKYIGSFSQSTHFRDFLITAITCAMKETPTTLESLLDSILHLIHICSKEKNINIEKYGTFYEEFISENSREESIAGILYSMLTSIELKEHHSKIRAIFATFHEKYDILKDLSHLVVNFDALVLSSSSCEHFHDELEQKKTLAKQRQAKLLAKFKKQQSSFMKKNSCEGVDCSDIEIDFHEETSGWKFPDHHCILCQNVSDDAGPFGIISYIAKSSEFRNIPFDDEYWLLKAFSDPEDLDGVACPEDFKAKTSARWTEIKRNTKENNVIGPGFPRKYVENKLVSLSCGHGMHFQCYLNFLNNNKSRLNQITRNTPENLEYKEFLCPLCKALNNMFVPILWTSNNKSFSDQFGSTSSKVMESSPFEGLGMHVVRSDGWFHRFCRIALADIEQSCCISPSIKDILMLNSMNMDGKQMIKNTFSHMFQTLSVLTFPYIFKAENHEILVNTIKSSEIGLRGVSSDRNILDQLSNNSLISLRSMNEFRYTAMLIRIKQWMIPATNSENFVKILALLLKLAPDEINKSILEKDFFDLLVGIVPIPSLGFLFYEILRMCFLGHLIQLLYLTVRYANQTLKQKSNLSILDFPILNGIPDNTARQMLRIISNMGLSYSVNQNEEHNDIRVGRVYFTMLIKACTPFLRQALIFAFVRCADLEDNSKSQKSESFNEVSRICSFMNLPTLEELIQRIANEDDSLESRVFVSFALHVNEKSLGPQEQILLKKNILYPGMIRLVDLPQRLDYFFTNYYYLDKYDKPHLSIEDPAVCLFCGKVLDAQKKAMGCNEGQCTTHFLKDCTNGIGLFLLPKDRCFLLMHRNGGTFYHAPYFNQHGELPSDAKGGKTLHLVESKYDEFIRNVWLLHNVANQIVRKLDNVMDAGGWDTL